MKTYFSAILVAAAVALAGCAGTSATIKNDYRLAPGDKVSLQLTTPKEATEEGVMILRSRLTSELSGSGLLAAPAGSANRVLDVTVTNYYMRHGATRALVGVMAGSDNIRSTVRIKDPTSGTVLTEFNVESKNPTAMGTSRGMIEDHANKIVDVLRGAKR